MIEAARNWVKRNRTRFAVGLGLLGGGYLVVQYVLSKIVEARERMSVDRIARENLRRRFRQNQEDCTFTVLALLPTVAENILEALPVEDITHELQQQRAEKLGRSVATSEISPSEFSSGAKSNTEGNQDEEAKSQGGNSQSGESFVHTSQMGQSTFAVGAGAAEGISSPKKTKAQLWNELKIQSVTRTFTLVYTLALLTLFTRIQLNLLGRRSYLSSVVSLASPQAQEASTISLENHDDDRGEGSYGSDFETNRKFLTFSWWILNRGWKSIKTQVEAAVNDVFGSVNVREDVSLERLSQLVVEVRKKVEGATEEERRSRKWLSHILPPAEEEMVVLTESGVLQPATAASSSVALATPSQEQPPPLYPAADAAISAGDPLRRLLDETSDLLDSPTASHITTLLLDSLFSHLTDVALRTQAFKLPPLPSSTAAARQQQQDPMAAAIDPSQRVVDVTERSVPGLLGAGAGPTAGDPASARAKLATVLAVTTRQAHAVGSGVPNDYVQAMEGVRELEAFAAVVYSSNFELDGVPVVDEDNRPQQQQQHHHAGDGVHAASPSTSWNPISYITAPVGWVFGGWRK